MKRRSDYPFIIGFLLVVLCASLLGQSSPAPGDAGNPASTADTPSATAGKPHDNSFVIGNDDRLSISVWKEADLSESVPVRSDGKISMPLIGEIQAAGRTPLQLEQDVTGKLKAYITDPEVTVIVLEIRSKKFNILGRVMKPGSFSLTAPTTILDAIAEAGGFQEFAKQKDIYILRQNRSGAETRIPFNYKDVIRGRKPDQNIRIEPNDTIVVP